MRRWLRATSDRLCGLCHGLIHEGEPVLLIDIGPTIKLYRCERCAGPAPPDLPPLVAPVPIPRTVLTRFSRGMLPLDWKTRGVGREPGEEG